MSPEPPGDTPQLEKGLACSRVMTYREIDARQAHEELSAEPRAVYVDVRSPQEYDQGHPEGAWNLPVALPGLMGMKGNAEFLDVAARMLPRDVPLILGCKSGQRSAMACQILAQAGFGDLANVSGGFLGEDGWAPCGLPSTAQPTPGRTWDDLRRETR